MNELANEPIEEEVVEPVEESIGAPETPEAEEPQEVPTQEEQEETVKYSRFKQVYGQAKANERRVQALEAELAKRPEPRPEEPAPNYDDFDTEGDYLDAKIKHETAATFQQMQHQHQQQQMMAEAQRRDMEFGERLKKGHSKYDDFDVVYSEDTIITPLMRDILVDTNNPDEIAYHLAKHPEKASSIASMPPFQAAREIFDIGEKVKIPPQKTKTKAPDPVKPVSGEDTPTDIEKMSYGEYEAYMNKREFGG